MNCVFRGHDIQRLGHCLNGGMTDSYRPAAKGFGYATSVAYTKSAGMKTYTGTITTQVHKGRRSKFKL
jgi:hypothetical protein